MKKIPNKRRKAVKSGCAFLCLLSFAQAKESMVAHRAKSELTTSKEKVSRHRRNPI
ncbi:hypothetical protein [Lonepinella sp. BR2357]|uniref:hypothetical protein n=1 Tax=Lonepinella sp. BR2357 TaxID=3434549 RepID=UPI003F6E0E2C